MAISGNVAIIGTPQATGAGVGAAYLFDVTTGQQLFKLTASDGRPRDFFGSSVAISGDIAIVGASGTYSRIPSDYETTAAYLFDVKTGQQLRKLESDNSFDGFGMFVDIHGTTAMVAAPLESGGGELWSAPGSVYLFDVSTGELLKKIVPSDTHPGQAFGHDVGIDGDFAVVGARYGDDGSLRYTGSAYLFDVSRGPGSPATSTPTARSTPPTTSSGATAWERPTPKPTTTRGGPTSAAQPPGQRPSPTLLIIPPCPSRAHMHLLRWPWRRSSGVVAISPLAKNRC